MLRSFARSVVPFCIASVVCACGSSTDTNSGAPPSPHDDAGSDAAAPGSGGADAGAPGADASTPDGNPSTGDASPSSGDTNPSSGDASPSGGDAGAPGDDAATAGETSTPGGATDAGSAGDSSTGGTPDAPTSACTPAPSGWRSLAAPPVMSPYANFGFPAWTGKEVFLLVSGVVTGSGEFVQALAYDPVADTWRSMAKPPFLLNFRGFAVSAWTGSQWLLYGAWPTNDASAPGGYLYDPSSDTWTPLARPPVSPRDRMWGGYDAASHKLFMFGGSSSASGSWSELSDGAAFDVSTKTWTSAASAPFTGSDASTAWASGRLVAGFPYRHVSSTGDVWYTTEDVAAYDPTSNAWTTLAAPPVVETPPNETRVYERGRTIGAAGNDAFFFLDFQASPRPGEGSYWNASTSTWTNAPYLFGGTARLGFASWSANGVLYAWGGQDAWSTVSHADGASFDPSTGTVTPMPTAGAPSARYEALGFWTGCDAIVLGGNTDTGLATDGARFRP